jgi:hypothetical protein
MRLEVASPTSQGGGPRARNRSKGYKTAQRFLAGVSLGVLGFFGGGLAGAAIDGVANSGGESPGLAGFMIGAPIGAAVGATIGVMITRWTEASPPVSCSDTIEPWPQLRHVVIGDDVAW